MTHDLSNIETPAFLVDEAVALRNIRAFQDHCDRVGLHLRPHIKTHKLVRFAKAQIAAGAVGITCQKIGEAEVMADGGIRDILITYNILGDQKLARLRNLAERLDALAVTADNATVVDGLSQSFSGAEKPLTVLVECDTGAKRCGVQSPLEAAKLAGHIAKSAGLRFGGLMTYPAVKGAASAAEFMRETKAILAREGLDCLVISTGGSPDMWTASTDGIMTEYRIGTYIYNDRSLVVGGVCDWSDCAGQVLATVVSTPTSDRAIIDAGSKVLTSDLLGMQDHGYVVDYPEVRIVGLSEEHGTLVMDPARPLVVGQRVRIIPNHVCVVSNMLDEIYILAAEDKVERVAVDARGCVT